MLVSLFDFTRWSSEKRYTVPLPPSREYMSSSLFPRHYTFPLVQQCNVSRTCICRSVCLTLPVDLQKKGMYPVPLPPSRDFGICPSLPHRLLSPLCNNVQWLWIQYISHRLLSPLCNTSASLEYWCTSRLFTVWAGYQFISFEMGLTNMSPPDSPFLLWRR